MSWLYRNSAAWRSVVQFTRQGVLNMALFSLAITAVAWYGGEAIMQRCVGLIIGCGRHAESWCGEQEGCLCRENTTNIPQSTFLNQNKSSRGTRTSAAAAKHRTQGCIGLLVVCICKRYTHYTVPHNVPCPDAGTCKQGAPCSAAG